jgi:hypothetical protein
MKLLARRTALPAAVALIALAVTASASQARVSGPGSALSAPTYAAYITGVFQWSAVRKADHYEFELAADKGFNSPVLGGSGSFQTWSTSATLTKTLQDGKYWWRVRAVRKNGNTSAWVAHSFTKGWTAAPTLLKPDNNASISFPTEPLLLSWKPLLGAVHYAVAIAHDPSMTSLVDGAQTVTTATSYIPPSSLADGTYYWTVTPVDDENHDGTTSAVRSFTWGWPTGTNTTVNNLIEAPDDATTYDPLLKWDAVPGAAKYQLDINYSEDFNPSSSVCCSGTTVATGYSPLKPLPNNTYFWRVRPINAKGENGAWTCFMATDCATITTDDSFLQYFDTIPPLTEDPTIADLHMEDEYGDTGPLGWANPAPVVVWKPVAGAASYDLDVYTMRPDTGVCDIQWAAAHGIDRHVTTPLTSWTPLASPGADPPYPSSGTSIEKDGSLKSGDHYCVRIRAVGESSSEGGPIYGDYTYLPAPGSPAGSGAFTYAPATDTRTIAMPQASDYLAPVEGTVKGQTPLFTWNPIAGANSYWIIIARDPSFTTLVDYGFTDDPAYAPRKAFADEKTLYYWAVLPAANSDGSGLPTDPETGLPVGPLDANAANFQKQSAAPTRVSPDNGAVLAADKPKFQWTPVGGALNYRLQVSTDPNFGTLLDNVVTGSTSYVSTTTYPAQSTLYWRVQANDDDNNALTWSSTWTFKQVLPTPQSLAQASSGDLIPTWSWAPVAGALGYDVHVIYPGGSTHDYKGLPTPAMVPTQLTGTGVYRWQVRAYFAGSTVGPYSGTKTFRRDVTPPTGTRAAVSQHALILRWLGRPGLAYYRVRISSTPDFSHTVETDQTEGTVVASSLNAFRDKGGRFYWQVEAIDAGGNTSGWSSPKIFKIRRTTPG